MLECRGVRLWASIRQRRSGNPNKSHHHPEVDSAVRHTPIGFMPQPSRVAVRTAAVLAILAWGDVIQAQETSGRVRAGGIGRYVSQRWGLARGEFSNRTDEDVSLTAVVTPPGSNGFQYARRVQLPAQSSRIVQWPFLMPEIRRGLHEVQFLVFDPGDEDGAIQRRGPDIIRTFTTSLRLTDYGHTGLITSGDEPHREATHLLQLLKTMQTEAQREPIVLDIRIPEICGSAHALDGLDQLSVSANTLVNFPEACEAIRIWVQRGGRLHIALDQTGPDVAGMLLGEALPLTLVDTTSSNTLKLELNPEYSPMRFQVREVTREFSEPAEHVRVIADAGEVIWSIDGWPAAIRTPYGRGHVLVTTAAAGAFIHPVLNEQTASMIASSSRFSETLFSPPESRLLSRDLAVQTAAAQVGYSIPSRLFAATVVLGFPILLLACGLWLRRSRRGEWLALALPLLAAAACLPAAIVGTSTRSVAPPTAIYQQVVQAVDGESVLVGDGFVTLYTPDAGALSVETRDGGLFVPPSDPDNKDYRRLVWTGGDTAVWQNLAPPVGLQTAESRQVIRPTQPLEAVATLDENGLSGTLSIGEFTNAGDAVLGSRLPDRQAIALNEDGEWSSGRSDLLAANEYFTNTLMSEEQKNRTTVLDSVLGRGRDLPLPDRLSLFYWATAPVGSVAVGDDATRRQSDLLVVQPVRLTAPPIGQAVTIPPVLLPYRSIVDASGGISPLYSNRQRKWTERERPGQITLAFDVPEVCLPFEPTAADLEIRIVAGSRTLEVFSGTAADEQLVQKLESPVGNFTFALPPTALDPGGRVIVRLQVGENTVEREEGVTDVDQDDAWRIERVLLTLRGSRIPGSRTPDEADDD